MTINFLWLPPYPAPQNGVVLGHAGNMQVVNSLSSSMHLPRRLEHLVAHKVAVPSHIFVYMLLVEETDNTLGVFEIT
jgi:hypothetical protein